MSKKHEALFYTVKDMCEIIQTSRSSLYRMINSGVLQQPKRLTSRSVVWYREDINNWGQEFLPGPKHCQNSIQPKYDRKH